ncbi:F0F1 ATP synthase subunit A [Dongia deserti]|uniref:F0F1 ATP synthase subunit A n=1 Tax=Dongia deserti TaxID=2268030 RepID=UPI000E651330|nr:F0F1 ATP synthase subunit A [Dongia deserti]
MAAEAHSPLAQFEIQPLGGPIHIGGLDVSFTNSSLWMVIAVAAITAFMLLGTRKQAIVPGRWQSLCEGMYDFVSNMLRDNVGQEGRAYFPFVFSLFMFILFANVLGLLPGAFTVTSHIVVTGAMALFIFVMVTIVGIVRHGLHFFTYFAPQGAPMWLMPLMIPIEIISYAIRPMTLSIRLFANMVAGHVMLAVIGGFAFALGVWAGWLPIAAVTALFGLELLIACLQAYVFTILTCIYLHDAIHLH